MKDVMLKRQFNPFLLASTVLVLTLLAGLAVLFQGRLSDVVSEKKDLSKTLENKKDRIETLKAEKQNLTEKVATLSTSLENLKRQNSQLNSKIAAKSDRIVQLQNKVSRKVSKIEELELEVDRLEAKITATQGNLSEISSDFREVCSDTPEANLSEDSLETCNERFGEDTP